MTARDQFTSVVKGKNFMTPEVLQYRTVNKYAVEFSRGEAMDGGYIYGVTVVDTTKHEQRHDLSELFDTAKQAKQHIETLRKKD